MQGDASSAEVVAAQLGQSARDIECGTGEWQNIQPILRSTISHLAVHLASFQSFVRGELTGQANLQRQQQAEALAQLHTQLERQRQEQEQWQLEQDAAQAALKAQLVAQDRLYAKKMEVMQQKLDGLEIGAGTKADLDYIHEVLVSKSDKGEVYRTIATLETKVGDASEALKSIEEAVQSGLQTHEARLEARLAQIQSQIDKYEERTASALSQQVTAERHLSEEIKHLANEVAEKADRQSVANALHRKSNKSSSEKEAAKLREELKELSRQLDELQEHEGGPADSDRADRQKPPSQPLLRAEKQQKKAKDNTTKNTE